MLGEGIDPELLAFHFADSPKGRLLHFLKFRFSPWLKNTVLKSRYRRRESERLMYVSTWPGLIPGDIFRTPSGSEPPYPLNAAHRHSFCVARSGIYHLFRKLNLKNQRTVLAPDYYSGNEIGAIHAAGASIVHYPIRRNLEPDLEALARLVRKVAPRVVYVIHYLGWPQPMDEIQALCRENGSILVEDCALSAQRASRPATGHLRRLFGLLPVQDSAGSQWRLVNSQTQSRAALNWTT